MVTKRHTLINTVDVIEIEPNFIAIYSIDMHLNPQTTVRGPCGPHNFSIRASKVYGTHLGFWGPRRPQRR